MHGTMVNQGRDVHNESAIVQVCERNTHYTITGVSNYLYDQSYHTYIYPQNNQSEYYI